MACLSGLWGSKPAVGFKLTHYLKVSRHVGSFGCLGGRETMMSEGGVNGPVGFANRVPLWIVWGAILAVCVFLIEGGAEGLGEALSEQGVSPERAVWLLGIGAYTLPVVIGGAFIWWIVFESDMPPLGKWISGAVVVYGAGLFAATITANVGAIDSANLLRCPSGHPWVLAGCYGSRGLFMLQQSYSLQFAIAGLLVWAGAAFTIYRGAFWWQSGREKSEV